MYPKQVHLQMVILNQKILNVLVHLQMVILNQKILNILVHVVWH